MTEEFLVSPTLFLLSRKCMLDLRSSILFTIGQPLMEGYAAYTCMFRIVLARLEAQPSKGYYIFHDQSR